MAREKRILRIELSAKINAEVFENDSAEGTYHKRGVYNFH